MLPQWCTPERQSCMAEVWARYGNRCFQGHQTCPVQEHYQRAVPQVHIVRELVPIQATTRSGNPRYNPDGTPLMATAWSKPQTRMGYTVVIDRPFDKATEDLIAEWKSADARRRAVEWDVERGRMHALPDRKGWSHDYPMVRGRLHHHDPITTEQWRDSLPMFEVVGFGVDALTFHRTALVRIPGLALPIHLFVDVSKAMKPSRSARRKAARYGVRLPTVGELCKAAVMDWRQHHNLD